MREIKFEYVGYNLATKVIWRQVLTLEQIQAGREILTFFALDNSNCKMLARRQWTGLIDKNGVEIYEGDTIRICHYEKFFDDDPDDVDEFSIHEVKWGELAWVVSPTRSEEYNDLVMVGEGWEDGHLWMEVLGNIYENPELLNIKDSKG